MSKGDETNDGERTKELVQLLTPKRRESYAEASERLRLARLAFHEVAADQLRGPLAEHVRALPNDTRRDKQEIARWLNGELRAHGLALRCPKTGLPGILHADVSAPPGGRFQIEVVDRGEGRKRTVSSVSLPPIDIFPYLDRRDPLAEFWSKKVSDAKGKSTQRE